MSCINKTMISNNIHINNYYEKIKCAIKSKFDNKRLNAYVKTYGCQQNFSDGEKFVGMLQKMGYDIINFADRADVIVINTCAIREHAEKRIFGNIGALKNLKKQNPNLIIAVCGCMTEEKRIINKLKLSYPYIDLVFGTHSIHRFPEFIFKILSSGEKIFNCEDGDILIHEELPIKRSGHIKAFVPIMYGCNNFCSYCIVPYTRGRERSRLSESVVSETKMLIENGYKEVTLLGQNVNSYGENLDEEINFSKLLKKLDDFEGEYRIRFMTSHPKDATRELVDVMSKSKHICSNFHLPFQSGNNIILKTMNRGYTREEYLDIINYAKSKIDNLSISSDVIVGFPGETRSEFEDTLSLIKEIKFTSLFTFIYSKRPGTPATLMPDQIERSEKVKWLSELLDLQQEISLNIYQGMVGKVFRCLAENKGNSNTQVLARTDGNVIIETEGTVDFVGEFVDVLVTDIRKRTLIGKIL